MEKDPHRYDDMLKLPHHQSVKHPPMGLQVRAAQFSPYDALTGYEEQLEETTRVTDRYIFLSEGEQEEINEKLQILQMHLQDSSKPIVTVDYFEPDTRKEGGKYNSLTGTVKKIDILEQNLVFYAENGISSGISIPIPAIRFMECNLFKNYENLE